MHNWFVFAEFKQASVAAADFLALQIEQSLQQRDVCHVILPGGNTPGECLYYLSQKDLPWEKLHWYPGDERCFPVGHAERNDTMLEKHLWSHLPKTNIHPMPAELGAADAARLYAELISGIEKFDIAFLGMGEDGHTASLFPGNVALDDVHPVVPVYNSPKAPSDRVSFSLATLKKSRSRMVLTGGSAKADILLQIKEGSPLPINCVGDINWFVDEAALSVTD